MTGDSLDPGTLSSAAQRPSPDALLAQAQREFPDAIALCRIRYRELMIEHGHIVPRQETPMTQPINTCDEGCVIGPLNKTDSEDCEACCEHTLCLYHDGVDVGFGLAVDAAKKAWDG